MSSISCSIGSADLLPVQEMSNATKPDEIG